VKIHVGRTKVKFYAHATLKLKNAHSEHFCDLMGHREELEV